MRFWFTFYNRKIKSLIFSNYLRSMILTWAYNVSLDICDVSFFILVKDNAYILDVTTIIENNSHFDLPSDGFLTISACCLASTFTILGLMFTYCCILI